MERSREKEEEERSGVEGRRGCYILAWRRAREGKKFKSLNYQRDLWGAGGKLRENGSALDETYKHIFLKNFCWDFEQTTNAI